MRNQININNIAPMLPKDTICKADNCRVSNNIVFYNKFPKLENKPFGDIPIGDIHHIPASITKSVKHNLCNLYLRNFSRIYKVEDNKGINHKKANKSDICLAKYSLKVSEEMNTGGACYTGVKHALWASGVIYDYSDMPKGSASKSIEYFNNNPDKFQKLNISKKDLKNLPAGIILVYTKKGTDGHIAITNGNGQEMSDCTDNMKWLEKHGTGASFVAYKLSNNWQYDSKSKKLKYSKS